MSSEKPKGYVPPEAIVNIENQEMPCPEVSYEQRKKFFDIDAVKDVTKGKYGKKGD